MSRESPLETSQQALLDILQLHRWLIRCKDELLTRKLEVVEDIKEGVLRTCLTRKLLDVINDKNIDHLIEVDEVGNLAILVRCLELRLELIHRDVQHLKLRMTLTHLVTYGLHDMSLTKTRITIDIQRVEGVVTRRYRDSHTRRASQTVTLTLDMVVEGIVRVELRIEHYAT